MSDLLILCLFFFFPGVTNNTLTDKSKKGPVMSITLMKEGGGLGFSLEGGKDSPFGDLPLTIKKIFTGKYQKVLDLSLTLER